MSRNPTHPEDSVETCVSYRDEEGLVICDRTDPGAWIRSDVTVSLGEPGEDAEVPPSI